MNATEGAYKNPMHLKLAKVFFVLLLFYTAWFQTAVMQIPHMLLVSGSIMMLMLFLHYWQNEVKLLKALTMEAGFWLLFVLTSFFSGIFIAPDISVLLSSVSTLFQFYLVFIAVLIIADGDQSIDFFITIYLILSLLTAVTFLFIGGNYRHGRMSIGDLNPNTLGTILSNGVFCALYLFNTEKKLTPVISLSSIVLFSFVIIQTGSRRPFISASLLIVFWVVFVLSDVLSSLSTAKRILIISTLVVAILFAFFILVPLFTGSLLLERLINLQEVGNPIREAMYVEAIDFFLANPVLGIGFNQFRLLSAFQLYSHSTYGEVLSCTGIVGALTYFSVYFVIIYKLVRILRLKIDKVTTQKAKLFGILMIALIFNGVAMIHFYSIQSMVMFGIIIAFCNQCLNDWKDKKNEHQARIIVV